MSDGPRCGAVKHGGVTLRCELGEGHEGWHKAVFADNREMSYYGAHHVISSTEVVTWEPVDYAREAVRHLLANRAVPVTERMDAEVHEADGGDSMAACDSEASGYQCSETGPHTVHLARGAVDGVILHAWEDRAAQAEAFLRARGDGASDD